MIWKPRNWLQCWFTRCLGSPLRTGIKRWRRERNTDYCDFGSLNRNLKSCHVVASSKVSSVNEPSATIRQRVIAARNIQLERFRTSSNSKNSSMGSRQARQHCKLTPEANGYLEHAMEEMSFSARAHDRILKVARTLADLAEAPDIHPNDILEAIQNRSLDRKLFS
ncbi:MAG: hypothetical protein EON58_08310 [Alphaproteobacteria bacterium]|nr:MAG: hypothetical protein EON58_08310 [Alphaproteobacteria bacterium]